MCVCSFCYPSIQCTSTYALFSSVACSAPTFFPPHYLICDTVCKNKPTEYKICVLVFSATLSELFLILRRMQREYYIWMYSARYSCHILTKLGFLGEIFEKYPNIKFHEHPSSGSRRYYSRTDGRRTHMKKLMVTFRSFANVPKICCPEYIPKLDHPLPVT